MAASEPQSGAHSYSIDWALCPYGVGWGRFLWLYYDFPLSEVSED